MKWENKQYANTTRKKAGVPVLMSIKQTSK